MRALCVIARLLISVVAGWPLEFAPVLITEPLGLLNGWGYAHSGLPLFLYPVAIWFA